MPVISDFSDVTPSKSMHHNWGASGKLDSTKGG